MYELKKIPYSEIEGFLDSKTIDIHYNRIYRGYVNKLNFLLSKTNFKEDISLSDLIKNISIIPFDYRDDVLYLSGAITNHELYFESINNTVTSPNKKLLSVINKTFGDYEKFKEEFILKSSKIMGSGYTFLVMDKKTDLSIINVSNQDSPYSYDFTPLIALDVWEHAYFLDYYNNRLDYVTAFFNHINFTYANKIF